MEVKQVQRVCEVWCISHVLCSSLAERGPRITSFKIHQLKIPTATNVCTLVLAPSSPSRGILRGDIVAENVMVYGTIDGNLECKNMLVVR